MQQKETPVTLYGGGGHCKVVIDILYSLGLTVEKIVDDRPKSELFMSLPLVRPCDGIDKTIITIGNCTVRKAIYDRIKAKEYITAIHPSAIISPNAVIGKGTVIVHGAVVQSCANIGDHCIINTKSSIGHDVIVHDFVHVAPGATICGEAEIGECTWIGAGSVIKQGVKIGKNCMIGAGSVVVSDIPDNVVAFGNPCRVIRDNAG